MEEEKKTFGGAWLLIMLWAALGYFVYDGFSGMLAIIILCVLYRLAMLFAFVPFVGVIIQGLVMYFLIQPFVFEVTGITATWLTTLIFWVDIVIGGIITLLMTLLVFRR